MCCSLVLIFKKLIVDVTAFLAAKATNCSRFWPSFWLVKPVYPFKFRILLVYPGLPLMVFPLEAVELIKNLRRDRGNQVAQLPGNRLEKPNDEGYFSPTNPARKEM